jgi:GNAT superfamily N-acetyltransferase
MSLCSIHNLADTDISFEDLFALYTDAGWTAYTRQPDVLRRAIANSPMMLVAIHENRLVGLLRAVGDNLTIMYIQDIIVHSDSRKKGIGRSLVNYFLQQYKSVRQIVLMTDNTPETAGFYSACGFVATNVLNLQTYILAQQPVTNPVS